MLEICVKNIEQDRTQSKEAIEKIEDYIGSMSLIDPESFSKILMSYSKLIENLQKSNEQMVNIFLSKNKKEPQKESLTLSEEEKREIRGK
jgi:hypothetical protein